MYLPTPYQGYQGAILQFPGRYLRHTCNNSHMCAPRRTGTQGFAGLPRACLESCGRLEALWWLGNRGRTEIWWKAQPFGDWAGAHKSLQSLFCGVAQSSQLPNVSTSTSPERRFYGTWESKIAPRSGKNLSQPGNSPSHPTDEVWLVDFFAFPIEAALPSKLCLPGPGGEVTPHIPGSIHP